MKENCPFVGHLVVNHSIFKLKQNPKRKFRMSTKESTLRTNKIKFFIYRKIICHVILLFLECKHNQTDIFRYENLIQKILIGFIYSYITKLIIVYWNLIDIRLCKIFAFIISWFLLYLIFSAVFKELWARACTIQGPIKRPRSQWIIQNIWSFWV